MNRKRKDASFNEKQKINRSGLCAGTHPRRCFQPLGMSPRRRCARQKRTASLQTVFGTQASLYCFHRDHRILACRSHHATHHERCACDGLNGGARLYKLYDSYPDSPALVGTFDSVDEAREAARKRDEATGGKFFPRLVKDGKVIQDWGY